MQQGLTDTILSVCEALNKYSVEYLIVGGTAVAFHGYFRWSTTSSGDITEKEDLDFWYNPTYNNYFNLLHALEFLGLEVLRYKQEQTPNPKSSFFRFEVENFSMDFLPEINGLKKFKTSYKEKDLININGIEISVINFDDLIANKHANGRFKDKKDIEELLLRRNKME